MTDAKRIENKKTQIELKSDIDQITMTDDDSYWDTLRLADELYEADEYEKAEELYKKIANEKDVFGDASAHYGYLLDKLGRYEEAYFCFQKALNGDTSPAEGVSVFIDECLCNEDSPYWHHFYNHAVFSRYFEMCDSIGKNPDVERILLRKRQSMKRLWLMLTDKLLVMC